MNETLRQKYIANLNFLIERYETLSAPIKGWVNDLYTSEQVWKETGELGLENWDVAYSFSIQMINAILQICPPNSLYSKEAEFLYDFMPQGTVYDFRLYNLLLRLRDDLTLGFIGSVSSLIHQQIFADYLDSAQHLLDEGYKDASAVIAGSTLESHIRQLCIANQIEVMKDGNKRPKRAETINSELKKKKGVYSLYEQKMVTAQLDLRNNAAHGKYDQYTKEQVENFIAWLKDFMERNPA